MLELSETKETSTRAPVESWTRLRILTDPLMSDWRVWNLSMGEVYCMVDGDAFLIGDGLDDVIFDVDSFYFSIIKSECKLMKPSLDEGLFENDGFESVVKSGEAILESRLIGIDLLFGN